MVLACFLLLGPFGRRFPRLWINAAIVPPVFAICWMVYASEGSRSPYYAGLCLVVIGACLVFPYTMRDALWFSTFTLATYFTACVLHAVAPPALVLNKSNMGNASPLFNNLYFLTLTCIICVTATKYIAIRRFEDFRLRHELDESNGGLRQALDNLQAARVQLVQSEKMNALGKLSAGLLHEINNPLNFTFMALQFAESEAADNESLRDTLKDIGEGMGRIKGVIADLRAFAYPSQLTDRKPFDLGEALAAAARLTAQELGDIPVDRDGLRETKVLGANTQIVHVFMNLLVNAAHALRDPPAGRAPRIAVTSERRGDRVVVRVRDNGTGVKAADLPRLLDPFFTTKDAGDGTGLGLSICQTIVKSHGGDVRIDTAEGEWTEVSFDLPAYGMPAPAFAPEAVATEATTTTTTKRGSPLAEKGLEPVAAGATAAAEGSDES